MATQDDPLKDALEKGVDEALQVGIKQVQPESGLGVALKQAGWGGLILAVLIGNVPVTAAVTATMKQQAPLDTDAIGAYFNVFVMVTPWVLVMTVLFYWAFVDDKHKPNLPGHIWLAVIGGLVFLAGAISLSLGGAVPASIMNGPVAWTPPGLGSYGLEGLLAYLEFYGPWPVLAGIVEGGLFGYWISLLVNRSSG